MIRYKRILKIYNSVYDEADDGKKGRGRQYCPAAHCGRRYPQIIFGGFLSPIVRRKLRPQAISGMTADCRSLISRVQKLVLLK
jgi:hypothetical protein